MVLNKFTGSVLMDGNEDDLFKVFGTTLKHFASYVYLKALQAGDSIRIRVYDKVDDVSRYKLDGDVTDSVGSNNGTITNISSWVSQWKFDGNVNDSVGSNNGTITYHTNLKRLYKFESNINDATGTANGTLAAGTATYITGKEGNAFSFDGSTYLTAADTGLPTGTNSWSFSCWIQRTTSPAAFQTFFSYGTANTNQAVLLSLDSSYHLNYNSYGNATNVTSSGVLQINTWNFVTVTYDGTTIRLYINGVADGSGAYTLGTVLNAINLGQALGNNQRYTGYMDEARFYNITLTAAQVSALYMNGKFGQSHTFDGGEYITFGSTSTWNFLHNGTANSFSTWLKFPVGSLSGTSVVIGTSTSSFSDIGFILFIRSNGEIDYIITNGTSDYLSVVTATGVYPDDGNWHNITCTFDGITGTIYFDSVSKQTAAKSGSASGSNSTHVLVLGQIADLSGNTVNGQVDELRIYNGTALTASQVLGLYNYTGSNYITPLPVGNALSLDGSSYVTVTNQTPYNFNSTSAFSASCWFKFTASGNLTLMANTQGTNQGWEILTVSGRIYFDLINTNTTNMIEVHTNATWNDGNWHNLIITYTGSKAASGVTIYIDGVSTALTTDFNNLTGTISSSSNFIIGARTDATRVYAGLIDEVQIWNYVVSSAEINAINAGRFSNTHPIGLWHFDGDLYDYSGQGSTGSPTGTMTYVTGALSGIYNVPNTHFNFDGSEYVTATGTNFAFKNTDPFSVEFWIKTTSNAMAIIGNQANDGVYQGWLVYLNSGGGIEFFLTNTWSSNAIDVQSNTVMNDGLLHQILVTYDGTSLATGVKIYVDGVLTSMTTNVNSLTKSSTNSNSLQISGRGGSSITLTAEIDDIRVYNRALSSAEVLDLFNYPDSPMKELVYDRTYSGVKTDTIYVPMLQGNQYKVTCQQISGTKRIIPFERWEVT